MTTRRSAALLAAALATPALLAAGLLSPVPASADPTIHFGLVGRHLSGPAEGGAEVSAVLGNRMYVIDGTGLEIVDISDPAAPLLLDTIALGAHGASITSVATTRGLVAVAMPAAPKTAPGKVVVLDPEGTVLGEVVVGANPDMLVFDKKGQRLVVANEGEPANYVDLPGSDPEGTVSIIDVRTGATDEKGSGDDRRPTRDRTDKVDAAHDSEDDSEDDSPTTVTLTVRTAGFSDFNVGGPRASELSSDVRVFGPQATVAQDLEPEYVTISGDRAYVTLQENNAIAEIDLERARVATIRPLALKDHSLAGNGLDASDRDGAIAIANWPLLGMPLPDGIASFQRGSRTYLVTANEGDARSDWAPYGEDQRIKDLVKNSGVNVFGGRTVTLDPALLAALGTLKADAQLGRLKVTTAAGPAGGDIDNDGDIDRLQSFGTRSMTIWTTDGVKVWDSGDLIERAVAAALPLSFNVSNDENVLDARSSAKGPEPEGVTIGSIKGRTYAFVGLERVGGFVVFDITNPSSPSLVEYVNSRDFAKDPKTTDTDSGPEVLSFVSEDDSPSGKPLVVVSNEVSGTVSIWSPIS